MQKFTENSLKQIYKYKMYFKNQAVFLTINGEPKLLVHDS